jgi:hypothetical protein
MRSLKLLAVSVGLGLASVLTVSCRGPRTPALPSVPQTATAESRPTAAVSFAPLNPYAECPYHQSGAWRP